MTTATYYKPKEKCESLKTDIGYQPCGETANFKVTAGTKVFWLCDFHIEELRREIENAIGQKNESEQATP